MLLPQRDQNVRVTRTDQAGGGVLQVQRAVGQSDIVENVVHLIGWHGLADVLFDQIAEPGGLFNAGAELSEKIKKTRAGIAAWEEVVAEKGFQQKRAQAECQEHRNEDHSAPHGP